MALTSADVARRAGVSRSTVSYVLNGHGDRFSPETRKAVEDAVEYLGYRPQSAGRALARGLSDAVVVVLPLAANSEFVRVIDRLDDLLSSRGLSLLVRSSSASLASFEATMATVRPCAVIALSDLGDKERSILAAADVQTIEIARETSQHGGLNWRLGYLQASHLYERGFRQITYARLAEAGDDLMLQARELGVRDACSDLGIDEPQTVTVRLRADEDLEIVRALPAGSGIACYNDDTAAAIIGAANVVGRVIPAELGVVGMDNTPIATQTAPRLTTIAFNTDRGLATLVDRIGRPGATSDAEAAAEEISFEVTLVQGGST